MVALGELFRTAAMRFKDATVALVYAHSFDRTLLASHYLRQRTETLSGYADVVDLLGAHPVFFNIDQFLEVATDQRRYRELDFVINVPGGALALDHLLLPPAIAAKIGRPSFPASARSIAIGQNKPIATQVASTLGWPSPRSIETATCRLDGDYIVKPCSAGDSFGVVRLKGADLLRDGIAPDYFVQEFIKGYDLTTYIMVDPLTRDYVVLESSITLPNNIADTSWYWNSARKEAASGRGIGRFGESDHKREPRATSTAFDAACKTLCACLGVSTLARIDTRLPRFFAPGETVDIRDAPFLEINVLPSITPSGSWHCHINSHLESLGIAQSDVHPIYDKLPPMQAAMLFFLLGWACQLPDVPATGVDQLK